MTTDPEINIKLPTGENNWGEETTNKQNAIIIQERMDKTSLKQQPWG